MSRQVINLSQAFVRFEHRILNVYLFWSSDWFTRQPWTLNNCKIPYVHIASLTRESFITRFFFFGPLLIVTGRKLRA